MLVRDDGAGSSSCTSPSCSSIFLATIFGQNKHTHIASSSCLPVASSCPAASLVYCSSPLAAISLLCFGTIQSQAHTQREIHASCVYAASAPLQLQLQRHQQPHLSCPFLPFLGLFLPHTMPVPLPSLSSAHVPALCSAPSSCLLLSCPRPAVAIHSFLY